MIVIVFYCSIDYYEEMKEYGPIYTLWSASEEDLVDPLRGVAGCIDKCCKVTGALSAELSSDLIPIIHEYVLYGETLSVSAASCYPGDCTDWREHE